MSARPAMPLAPGPSAPSKAERLAHWYQRAIAPYPGLRHAWRSYHRAEPERRDEARARLERLEQVVRPSLTELRACAERAAERKR